MPKASWTNIEGNPFEDDLEEYDVYDGELPPKGVYRFELVLLRLKTNKNNDPMLSGMIRIAEPRSSKKAQYNGYSCWFQLNVTSQGARWVNNFLSVLVPEEKAKALRKAFWDQKVMLDKNDPPNVVSIGTWKFKEGLLLSANCKIKTYNDDSDLDPKQFMRPTDLTPADSQSEASDEDEEDWEEAGEEVEEVEGDEEEDEEFNARVAELEAMDRSGLLKAAKAVGVSVKRGTPEADIIDSILDVEFPEEEEPEEEAEEPEEAEEEEPEEEDEEEPEEEPEPPKTTRRRAPAKKAEAAPATAPARTRTGRRRKTGEPPF